MSHQVTPSAALGPVSAHIIERLTSLLDRYGLVVIYDGSETYSGLIPAIEEAVVVRSGVFVSAVSSELRARRSLDEAYIRFGSVEGPRGILVYVPRYRSRRHEEWREDLFAAYSTIGVAFGVQEAEQLRSLALDALPSQSAAIERQFEAGAPSLASLDALGQANGEQWPLLRQALGTSDSAMAVVRALTADDLPNTLQRVPGATVDLQQLLSSALGFSSSVGSESPDIRKIVLAHVLLTELEQSLPEGMPASLDGASRATGASVKTALAILAHLRSTDDGRRVVSKLAPQIETDYKLRSVLGAEPPSLARLDTFPLQDDLRFQAAIRAATDGDLDVAKGIADAGSESLWRADPERAQRWRSLERLLEFLSLARDIEPLIGNLPVSTQGIVNAYVAPDGFWRLDRGQRLFEQAFVECQFDDDLEPLLQHCRARYREIVGNMQERFQEAVKKHGWPPEGRIRQTQIFDQHVAPELDAGRKVAYFQVDSLRYELGFDLYEVLGALGKSTLEGAAATLPTSTPIGMASLLPGADTGLSLVVDNSGTLTPTIGDTSLPALENRRELLKKRYGDRAGELQLDQVISASATRLAKLIKSADLLVVRSLDIDDSGEARSLTHARTEMARVIGDIKRAVDRLIVQGFRTFIVASDHGHILLPEIPAGDVIAEPDGAWAYRKRRALVGRVIGKATGSLVLPALHLGIRTDPADLEIAFPSGLRTYRQIEGYFHEGLSLQECVVPVVILRAAAPESDVSGSEQVTISYRSESFTSSVVGLSVGLTSMLSQTLSVRIEAFNGAGPKAKRVGDAADCDARDPGTGEISLRAGETTAVPLLVDPDFSGNEIEVRAIDPRTNVVYSRLTLKNGRLD